MFRVCVCRNCSVSRIEGKSENYEMELLMDFHAWLFPLQPRDRFTLVMARTLDLGGAVCDGYYDPAPKQNLADNYDYAMHGIVYESKVHKDDVKMDVHMSFGGLLMRISGDKRNLHVLEQDKSYYLLLRRA
jgi:DNA-directed RNA polymerase I, II, and III subunit RPABC3